MTSLTFNSQKNCDFRGTEVQQLKSRILALESETDILNRIISINDQTLEEINELVINHLETLRNLGSHYINPSQITKGNTKQGEESYRNSYEGNVSIISKVNQAISEHCDSFRGTLQTALIDHNDDMNTLKKSLKISKRYGANAQSKQQIDCDTSIEEYHSSKAIFEVPIEVQLLKEVTDKYIQVDMANVHKHYIYEVPLQIHQIFQIPVELNQIYQIPVELNCQQNQEDHRIFEIPVEINEVFEVFDDQEHKIENIIQEIPKINTKLSQQKQNDQLHQMIKQLRDQIARLKEENEMIQYQQNHKFYEIPVEVKVFGDIQLLNDPKSLEHLPLQIQIQSKEQIDLMNFGSQKQTSFKHVQSKIEPQTRTDLQNAAPINSQPYNEPVKTSLMMSKPIEYQPLNSQNQVPETQSLKDIKQLNLYVDRHVDCEIQAQSAANQQIRNEFDDAPFQMEFYGDHFEIQMEVRVQTQSVEQQSQTDFYQIPQTVEKIIKIPFLKTVQVPIQVQIIKERIVKIPQLKIVQLPAQSNIIEIPVEIHLEKESVDQNSENQEHPLVLKSQNTAPIIAQRLQTQARTIVRQVPIEVIVQKITELPPKIVVRQMPIQVIVQKIIQLPPIVIMKQVPIEVIVQKEVEIIIEKEVQKIVEVPIQVFVQKNITIVREVPVEVYIENVKQIKVVEIREVPIEVIVEKEVIRQVEKIIRIVQTQIKEVPIEVIVEKIVYVPLIKEVSIEVIVEKIVYVPQIRQIPIEVQVQKYIQKVVQKIVQIPTFIQIPIQMILQKQIIVQKKIPILKQLPTQMLIERQTQKIVEIPVQMIRQVPIQVIVQVQKIKIIKQIVQVPVIMMIDQKNTNELSPIQVKNNQISSLGYYSADKVKEQQPSIDYLANEDHSGDIGRLRLQSNQPLLQNQEEKSSALEIPIDLLPQIQIRQIPVELIMINEAPAIKSVPKIYQLPTEVVLVEEIEKIVYVQKIVEVIMQKIVEVERIVEIPIEVIIQKPIYIERQKIVEIPIEVEVVKQIIVYRNRITEIPIEVLLQEQTIMAQPQQMNVLQSKTFSYDKQHNLLCQGKEVKQQSQLPNINQQNQADNMQRISSFHLINERTGMTQRYYEFPLNLSFLEQSKDFVVDISHLMADQNQYGEIIIEFPSNHMRAVVVDASVQASQEIQQIQSESIRLNSRNIEKNIIQLVDNEAQTVVIEQKLKLIEIPIQLELEEQVLQKELQVKYRNHIDDLKDRYQSQINELNRSIVVLQSIILQSNQEKQQLQYKIEQHALAKQSLLNKYQQIIQQVEQLKKPSSNEINHSNNRIYEVPISLKHLNNIFELPIEIILQKQGVDIEIQTEDIQLHEFNFIQYPIQVERDEFIIQAHFEDLQAQFQQEQITELKNQMKESKVENVYLEAAPVDDIVKVQLISEQIQTDLTLNQNEDIVVLRNTFDNPYETNEQQIHVVHQIQAENIIQQVTFSDHTIKQHKQYSCQTDSVPVIVQNYLYELPVEILQVPQTQEVSIQTQQNEMSQYSNKSSSSDQERDEQMLVQTERNSNIYSKQNKTETIFNKRKPYSDYFRSRIFEIPIQLNVKNDNDIIEIQAFDKKLESIEVQTQVSEKELDGLSQIWQSRQKQALLLRLTLVPAFEAVALLLQQPNTPKKSTENKIVRLGSELSNPGAYQNFSHAQSLTPNQLDGSVSYQKFPQPTININNISLIKKSSLHSQYNKFLGSLDMRQELLNHDSAIASVRLNNKRLMGFDKQQSSSQQQDIHNLSRQMIIEQNETINSRDINRIQTPNLEPHDLNFSDYATLKQKFYEPEDYKKNYQEMYQHSQNQIEGLKLKIGQKIQEVNELKIQIDQQTCRYQQDIRKLKEEMVKIQKESIEQYHIADNYRIKVEEISEEKVKLQEKQQILVERWERLKDQSEKLQNSTNKEIQRLRQIITEKMTQIKELKSDQYHQKEIYELQLVQFRQIIHQKSETVDTLEQQLQRRSDRIDQLLMLIEEMRKNISNHTSESDTAAIYEQQFVRVKQGFEQQKNELNYQIFELKQQNQQLKNKLNEEIKKSQELQQHITYLQGQLDEAKHDYSSLHHLKSELENNYMEGVKNLNCQLEQMKQIVREKEEFIHRIHPSLQKVAPNMTKSSHQQSPVRVQYLSKQPSQLIHDPSKGFEAYTKKLQGLIKKYERIIIQNQSTIEDQQDKVYEYLKDALQKQQQAQGLYLKLVDYENTINKVLVEKVTLQVENKRLTKQMELSQKKLSVLGNRLIEVARQRAEYDSDDDVYYQ